MPYEHKSGGKNIKKNRKADARFDGMVFALFASFILIFRFIFGFRFLRRLDFCGSDVRNTRRRRFRFNLGGRFLRFYGLFNRPDAYSCNPLFVFFFGLFFLDELSQQRSGLLFRNDVALKIVQLRAAFGAGKRSHILRQIHFKPAHGAFNADIHTRSLSFDKYIINQNRQNGNKEKPVLFKY